MNHLSLFLPFPLRYPSRQSINIPPPPLEVYLFIGCVSMNISLSPLVIEDFSRTTPFPNLTVLIVYCTVSLILSMCGIGTFRHVLDRKRRRLVGRRASDPLPLPRKFLPFRDDQQRQNNVDSEAHPLPSSDVCHTS